MTIREDGRGRIRLKTTLAVMCAVGIASLCGCQVRLPGQRDDEALAEQVREMARRRKQAEALLAEAVAADDAGRKEELYREALSLDPSYGKAHNNLGLVYLEGGDYGEAIGSLREAVQYLPYEPEPRFNLGYAYELVGRLESAGEQYEAAVRLSPKDPDYLESAARVMLRRSGPGDEAVRYLRRALEVETRPEHVAWIREQLTALGYGMTP